MERSVSSAAGLPSWIFFPCRSKQPQQNRGNTDGYLRLLPLPISLYIYGYRYAGGGTHWPTTMPMLWALQVYSNYSTTLIQTPTVEFNLIRSLHNDRCIILYDKYQYSKYLPVEALSDHLVVKLHFQKILLARCSCSYTMLLTILKGYTKRFFSFQAKE